MERIKKNKLNLIIADDDMDDQLAMQKAIWEQNLNHRITSVYNGQQLIDLLLRNGFYNKCTDAVPDCIFLDLKMPLMDGFDVLSFIKNHHTLHTIPVYILSTAICDTQKLRLVVMGADGFFQKTHSYSAMRETISDILFMVGKSKFPEEVNK